MRRVTVLPVLLLAWAAVAGATDVPITGLKLIVVDKTIAVGKAKAVFVAKDVAVAKGAGTDPSQIAATLKIAYDSASGAFVMPQGPDWLVNTSAVAKYVHGTAPAGGAVRVSAIVPGKLVKVVARSLGDTPLPIWSPPSGTVYVADTIVNGGAEIRLCTQFTGCVHKTLAGGAGYKLICKGSSSPDPGCTAAAAPTTTPCVAISGRFCDLGDGTVVDLATGLQWEQKTTPWGSGENELDLHDVDNRYLWAGRCLGDDTKLCQPNAAAEAACKAQTDVADWSAGCEQCGAAGPCGGLVAAITTVWDWLAQLNAAAFAGHSDWRLPSESACNACYTGGQAYNCTACSTHELETILRSSYPCFATPCIAPIFGPTAEVRTYLSSTTDAAEGYARYAWRVSFVHGLVYPFGKTDEDGYLRAVRGGS